MNTAPPPSHESLELLLTPGDFPPDVRADLEANARLQRKDPVALLAELIARRLGGVFTVRPASAA